MILQMPAPARRGSRRWERRFVQASRVVAPIWFGIPALFRKARRPPPGVRISGANPKIELVKCGEDLQVAWDLMEQADVLLKTHARFWWERLHSGGLDFEVTNEIEFIGIRDKAREGQINVWHIADHLAISDPAAAVAAAIIQLLCQGRILRHANRMTTLLNYQRLSMNAGTRFLKRYAAHTCDPDDELMAEVYGNTAAEVFPTVK